MQANKKSSALILAALLLASGLVPLAAIVPTASASHPAIGITQQEWYDVDHNGHLDAVVVTAASVNLAQTYPSDFQIGGGPFATGISPGRFGDATPNAFTLYFPECFESPDLVQRARATNPQPASDFDCRGMDAGANTPTMTMSVLAHSPHFRYGACTGSSCKEDRAPPVLKAAYAIWGSSSITAVFSEPINTVTGNNFCFENSDGDRFPVTVTSTTFPRRTVDLRVMNLTQPAPPAAAVYQTLSANDTAVERLLDSSPGVDPPARLYMHQQGADCDTAPLSAFEDPQGNDGVDAYSAPGLAPNWPNWPHVGAVPVGAPVPVRVHASVGDNRVVVEFTGPVGDNGGQALGAGFAVSGNPQNWGISSGGIRQTASSLGSDRVAITATVRLLDLTNFVVTSQSTIYGTGSQASTPGMGWPLSDVSYLSSPKVIAFGLSNTCNLA